MGFFGVKSSNTEFEYSIPRSMANSLTYLEPSNITAFRSPRLNSNLLKRLDEDGALGWSRSGVYPRSFEGPLQNRTQEERLFAQSSSSLIYVIRALDMVPTGIRGGQGNVRINYRRYTAVAAVASYRKVASLYGDGTCSIVWLKRLVTQDRQAQIHGNVVQTTSSGRATGWTPSGISLQHIR